jgi:hypothetical protein
MPKKKEKTTMLIRDVPLDVSERIRRFCRKEGIKYREFVEIAIDLFEGPHGEEGQNQAHAKGLQEQASPIERVAEIIVEVKAYKEAIRLKKDLKSLFEDIGFLADWEHQVHIYMELVKMTIQVDDIIKANIPKYEIPDDPTRREAMGLPEKYWEIDVITMQLEQGQRLVEEASRSWKRISEPGNAQPPKELREKIEKLKRQFRGENIMAGLKPDEDSAKPLMGKEQINFGVAATAEPYQGPAKDEPEPEPGKGEIKVAKFGRGVGDGIKGGGDE